MHVRAYIRAALIGALALCLAAPAVAQGGPPGRFLAIVVSSCGSVTLPLNDPATPYMDRNGNFCTTGGSGGGSGSSPVIGSLEQDVRATQTLNAATLNAAVSVAVNGQGTLGFNISGLAASGATLTFEQSEDGGTTWTVVNEVNAGTGVPTSTRTTDGQSRISTSGRTNIRFRVSTAGTGTITITTNLTVREGLLTLASPLPPGTNTIGATIRAGSTGADFSANAAAVPISGYVLLATIPATPTRAFVEVQNQSANTIQVVRDDGAGANQTSILLTGTGAGQQGGGWPSDTFKGRVRVYGPTGSQVAAYQD